MKCILELACGRKYFDGPPVKDINGRLFIYDKQKTSHLAINAPKLIFIFTLVARRGAEYVNFKGRTQSKDVQLKNVEKSI